MNKVILFHTSYGIFPMLEYELDAIQRELDLGNHVVVATCNGEVPLCSANLNGWRRPKKRLCYECKSKVRNGFNWLSEKSGKLTVVGYDSSRWLDHLNASYKMIETMDFKYKGIDLYNTALSGYITDEGQLLDKVNSKRLSQELVIALSSTDSAELLINQYKPEVIYLFNGRLPRYQPLLRYARSRDIVTNVIEYPIYGYKDYIITRNTYPHDLTNFSNNLKNIADSKDLIEFEKIQNGQHWFNSRFSHNQTDYSDSFIKNQIREQLPINWQSNKFNLIIFTSTELEFQAIPEVKNQQFYSTQFDAMCQIFSDLVGEEIQITIRMHPNSIHDVSTIEKYNKFANIYENVTVLEPESIIDSYKLVGEANLVLVFGSTIGVEAAFIKKPVILVGPSIYEAFDLCAKPNSHDSLIDIIKGCVRGNYQDFPPPEVRFKNACLYAYAYMNIGVKAKYINKNNYFNASMVRDGMEYPVKPSFLPNLINRLFSMHTSISNGLLVFLKNKDARSKFFSNPFYSLYKTIFIRQSL